MIIIESLKLIGILCIQYIYIDHFECYSQYLSLELSYGVSMMIFWMNFTNPINIRLRFRHSFHNPPRYLLFYKKFSNKRVLKSFLDFSHFLAQKLSQGIYFWQKRNYGLKRDKLSYLRKRLLKAVKTFSAKGTGFI